MNLPDWARIIGPVASFFGLLFLWWIHRKLGDHWSPMAEVIEEHKLVTKGPYRYIRHPMYTVFYIFSLSIWLGFSNWFIGIFSFLPVHILCTVRIKAEEKMLIEEFGREYTEYIKKTGSILPKFTGPPSP
jgi:protein-S-isoprenylcysteine O-methyltransferase Ste14